MTGYIDNNGNYYEGARQFSLNQIGTHTVTIDGTEQEFPAVETIYDKEVQKRPSPHHDYINDQWVFNAERRLTKEIRPKRDALLRESDFSMLEDAPFDLAKKQDWKNYRKALRDFPTVCDPLNPVWPSKPV